MSSQLRWQSVAKGVGTPIPGLSTLANSVAGHPVTARYFYTVWLRHLSRLEKVRPGFRFDVVAELGPGDALGLGLCALLSGADRYVGLDRSAFGLRADNLRMLDELLELFTQRSPIPGDTEFPGVHPRIDDHRFPAHILTEARLQRGLMASRLDHIRAVLKGTVDFSDSPVLNYAAPWDSADQVQSASVDLVISQAVLEHVDEVAHTYRAMRQWLKPEGLMSHRIDYTCHGITRDWYGHWTVSDSLWRVVRGKRAYLINRFPHSAHAAALNSAGFEIVACDPTIADPPAPRREVKIECDASDLSIQGAYLIARAASR